MNPIDDNNYDDNNYDEYSTKNIQDLQFNDKVYQLLNRR